jgi:quercetin dioxygenase-like cupin family protein
MSSTYKVVKEQWTATEERVHHIYAGRHFKDLKTHPVHPVNLEGWESSRTSFDTGLEAIKPFLAEVQYGGHRDIPGRHKHYYEAFVYVVSGKGTIELWKEEGSRRYRFPYHEGSVLSPPLNWHHDHFPDKGSFIRYLAIINVPLMGRLIGRDQARGFDLTTGRPLRNYARDLPYDPEKVVIEKRGDDFPAVYKGVWVEDLRSLPLSPWPERGGLGIGLDLSANTTIGAHVVELPPGTTRKPHRHYYESFLYILSGTGYTRVWSEKTPEERYEWGAGDLIAGPVNTWHEHGHRGGKEAARYLEMNSRPIMEKIMDTGFVFKDSMGG